MKLVIIYNLNLIEIIYVIKFLAIVIAGTTNNNKTLNSTLQLLTTIVWY